MNSIFIHVATINHYKEILERFVNQIEHGLSGAVRNIFVCVSGNGDLPNLPSNYIVQRNGDLKLFEFPTLELLKKYCSEFQEDNVLYIHTKGVSTPNNHCIDDWREYMSYFVVDNYDKCINHLSNGFDTCGVDLRQEPTLHYSGNFWWSRASHINTLPAFSDMPVILSERHKAEFWVCSTNGKHKSLWESGIPSNERHLHLYPEENYVRF